MISLHLCASVLKPDLNGPGRHLETLGQGVSHAGIWLWILVVRVHQQLRLIRAQTSSTLLVLQGLIIRKLVLRQGRKGGQGRACRWGRTRHRCIAGRQLLGIQKRIRGTAWLEEEGRALAQHWRARAIRQRHAAWRRVQRRRRRRGGRGRLAGAALAIAAAVCQSKGRQHLVSIGAATAHFHSKAHCHSWAAAHHVRPDALQTGHVGLLVQGPWWRVGIQHVMLLLRLVVRWR